MPHQASCVCGQLALRYEGEITRTSICHCHACQRRTGSVFGVQVRLTKADTFVKGETTTFKRFGDDGGLITSYFCPQCGSTVFWEIDVLPGSIIAAAGAFADQSLPAPTFSVYEARMHPWVSLPDEGVEHMD